MIDSDNFGTLIAKLGVAFRTEISAAQIAIFFEAMQHLSTDGVAHCINSAIKNESKFPTVNSLLQYQSTIPKRPALQLEHRSKFDPDSLKNHAMKLISGHMSGQINERHLVEGMGVLERVYPSIGWKENAEQMAAYYSKRDRDVEQERLKNEQQGV